MVYYIVFCCVGGLVATGQTLGKVIWFLTGRSHWLYWTTGVKVKSYTEFGSKIGMFDTKDIGTEEGKDMLLNQRNT